MAYGQRADELRVPGHMRVARERGSRSATSTSVGADELRELLGRVADRVGPLRGEAIADLGDQQGLGKLAVQAPHDRLGRARTYEQAETKAGPPARGTRLGPGCG